MILRADSLRGLLGTQRPVTTTEACEDLARWRMLKAANAPFRVVTQDGLVSAPADHFDHLLIEQATPDWKLLRRLIGDTMGNNCEPYIQTGSLTLLARVAAPVAAGELQADGDLWRIHARGIRLPA